MSTQSQRELVRELHMHEWAPFFAELNRRLEQGELFAASIEVYTPDAGGTEAEMLPLDAITYEEGDDQIAIGLGGRGRRFPAVLWHYVDQPLRVCVHEHDGELSGIRIGSRDGSQTLLHLEREEPEP